MDMASTLTKQQLENLRRRLEQERARILRVLESVETTSPRPEQETEFEEAAQRQTEQEQGLEVAARERALLVEVERALAKFAAGTYGTGEHTGAAITYERLLAVPWAREPAGG
ncbi:TraR/DksA family transcriptional regulator [Anaeromyxobacter paludicola]|uniref:DksA C4-type domain-containing protein n=1 Tax=Anaeromyxobacter paludicola TaxID=2918171 RepID=A0ABM7X638_9BACT|nr:TraR/DksA family transcriptional regulator [Anaeromyxobacter paludicola]BDG07286.1 hypothetical protein AMPC_03990 [Anaeromyxobacter paludicola]